MLVDDVTITLTAGKGGDGSIHFFRAGHNPKGGPDGGNGGKGGDIYIVATHNVSDLSQFTYKKEISAQDGEDGKGKKMHGKNGEDITIKVPLGTSITDLATNRTVELEYENKPFLIAKGGKGGRGNDEFKSATNRAPQIAEKGEMGVKKEVRLVLKLIAHIGLIGKPNAGKSSLLAQLTNANPKIGSYPFTTLEPNLGVFDNFIIADIPGLIEGAHQGRGLGIKFLQHIEKTQLLVHCIDITEDELVKTYNSIREEFREYNNGVLLEKEEIILLTKTDLVQSDRIDKAVSQLKKMGKQIHTVSIYDQESLQVISNVFKQKLS